MHNFNGTLVDSTSISINNRAVLYGDALFETVRVVNGKACFVEDHYFRLMASLRILRMRIPQNFTLEYFEEQLLSVTNPTGTYRVRMTVYRNEGGRYTPVTNTVSFIVDATPLENELFVLNTTPCEVDLYKDFHIANHLLSTLKTTNRLINIVGSIFAQENELDNCLLINESKNVVETLNGNLFMVTGTTIVTPPLSEGCLNGILRKQLLRLIQNTEGYTLEERPISPFELQKADELFYTNSIQGIQTITKYRKKEFDSKVAMELINQLNALI
ncbi:MAG: aminotransferase class IV [Microcystis aeruginosa Ma_QC_Ch_20071001_M135]|nr:MAG: aminotransferase class IV [Microcystis aeruginosa Ma_QC_Ch_20071001_M135]